jgi:hypothetical protein
MVGGPAPGIFPLQNRSARGTVDHRRIVGLYRVLKTDLAVYYRHHVLVTDPVCDAPTVRVLNHILLEEEEHVRWGQAIYEELADTPEKRRDALHWQMELEDLLIRSGGVTGGR